MNPDDEAMHERYRRSTTRTVRGSSCPGSEELARLALGEVTAAERETLADHLARCSDCVDEYRLAGRLQPWAEKAAAALAPASAGRGAVPARGRRAWRAMTSPWKQVLAAAALLVVIVGGVQWWRATQRDLQPVTNERGQAAVSPAMQPPDQAVLPEPPARFVWAPLPAAESYQVVLYDFESTPIWNSPSVRESVVALPPEVRGSLIPGRLYYWRIIVTSGIDRRPTELFRFTLARR